MMFLFAILAMMLVLSYQLGKLASILMLNSKFAMALE